MTEEKKSTRAIEKMKIGKVHGYIQVTTEINDEKRTIYYILDIMNQFIQASLYWQIGTNTPIHKNGDSMHELREF